MGFATLEWESGDRMSDTCAETFVETRTLYLSGDIGVQTVHETLKAVDAFEMAGADPVRVVVSSTGGSECDAWAVYDALRTLSGHVTVDGFGCVWSAATIILQAGDWRRLGPNASLLIHDSIVPKEEPPGNYGDLIRMQKDYRADERRYLDLLVSRSDSRLRSDQIRRWSRSNKFLTADLAVEHGLADEIIEPRRKRRHT